MRSRNINPDRIRRHMARSTPDEISALFDPIGNDPRLTYEKWLHKFSDTMLIKHGKPGRIDIWTDEHDTWRHRQVEITARFVKEE